MKIGPPIRHGGAVKALAFRPDGKVVATGDSAGEILLSKSPAAPWTGDAATIAERASLATGLLLIDDERTQELSREKWQQFRSRLHAY